MNEPIDDLTLTMLAKRAPRALLFTRFRHVEEELIHVQHAKCCVVERNGGGTWVYYLDPPRGPMSFRVGDNRCAFCGSKITEEMPTCLTNRSTT